MRSKYYILIYENPRASIESASARSGLLLHCKPPETWNIDYLAWLQDAETTVGGRAVYVIIRDFKTFPALDTLICGKIRFSSYFNYTLKCYNEKNRDSISLSSMRPLKFCFADLAPRSKSALTSRLAPCLYRVLYAGGGTFPEPVTDDPASWSWATARGVG